MDWLRRVVVALIGATLLLLAAKARAGTVVVDDSYSGGPIGLQLELYEDPTATAPLSAIQSAPFQASTRASPNMGLTRSAIWARFTLRDLRTVRTPLILELEYPAIDRVEVFPPGRVVGDTVPFGARSIPFRQPNVELPMSAETTYYVRLSGDSSIQVALQLWTPSAHARHVANDMTFQGVYVGVLGAMIIYNLFLFAAVRSRSYLFYALFIAAFLGYQGVLEGLAYQFLFPSWSYGNNHGVPFFLSCAGCFGMLFAQRLLDLHKHLPRVSRATLAFAWGCAVLAPLTLAMPPRLGLKVSVVMAFTFSVGLLIVGIARALQKSRSAILFLIGWGTFLVASALAALRAAGKVPTTPFTTYAQQVGSTLEVLILSLALADRINALRNEAAEQQSRAAKELQRLNQELRRQISDRSRALADALAAIEAPGQSGMLSPGELFDGRFRVVRAIGQGGMGVVVEVERIEDNERLALKVMSGRSTPMASARFAREAELAARVSHPNLVAIKDVGVTAEGSLYLVMEMVDGASLESLRARFGERAFAISVLSQLAAGLAALHEANVVHRDLKPGNVLRAQDGTIKIADFGIAREDRGEPEAVAADAETIQSSAISGVSGPRALTGTGAWLGTPMYMAPEMMFGVSGARPACDVFAFGVIAWELLTAAHPFRSPVIYDVLAGRSLPEPAPLPASLDDSLRALLNRCVRLEPKQRPSARALADAFAAIERGTVRVTA
jgi:hypothetical protein